MCTYVLKLTVFFCVIFDEVFFTFPPGSCKTGMYVCFVELVGVSSRWVATTVAIGWKQAMLYIYITYNMA